MKLVYKPFGIIFGLIAGLISRKVFDAIWSRVDAEQPPKPTTDEASTGKIVAAAALQAAVFATTRALVDRWGAQGFRYFTGIWPGDKKQKPRD